MHWSKGCSADARPQHPSQLLPRSVRIRPTSSPSGRTPSHPQQKFRVAVVRPFTSDACSPAQYIGYVASDRQELQRVRQGSGRSDERMQDFDRRQCGSCSRPGRLASPPNVNPDNESTLNPGSLSHCNQISTLLLRTAVTRQRCCDRTLRSKSTWPSAFLQILRGSARALT